MSLLTAYSTQIRVAPYTGPETRSHPTWRLLEQALQVTAEEFAGELKEGVVDYYGNYQACDFALVTPIFPRGLGVKVSPATGEVRFLYDPYGGYERHANRLRDSLTQNYTALAVAEALRTLNYEVEMEEERIAGGPEKRVVVRGAL
ncbi:MAG: hypothetical protein RDU89_09890 [bacterium]|nr:hypothetical protein [bacterium]